MTSLFSLSQPHDQRKKMQGTLNFYFFLFLSTAFLSVTGDDSDVMWSSQIAFTEYEKKPGVSSQLITFV